MTNLKLREMILCALFIALITAGTFIKIPVGTDVYTLQFLFTLLAGLLLGPKLGALAVAVYVLMGLLGIPVFAEGGGPAYVLQPTFGYLIGFIVQAGVNGWLSRKLENVGVVSLLGANLAGMAVVYLFGLVYFYIASNYFLHAPIAVWGVIWYCGILQAPPDFLLCSAASLVGLRCYRAGLWIEEAKTAEKIRAREA